MDPDGEPLPLLASTPTRKYPRMRGRKPAAAPPTPAAAQPPAPWPGPIVARPLTPDADVSATVMELSPVAQKRADGDGGSARDFSPSMEAPRVVRGAVDDAKSTSSSSSSDSRDTDVFGATLSPRSSKARGVKSSPRLMPSQAPSGGDPREDPVPRFAGLRDVDGVRPKVGPSILTGRSPMGAGVGMNLQSDAGTHRARKPAGVSFAPATGVCVCALAGLCVCVRAFVVGAFVLSVRAGVCPHLSFWFRSHVCAPQSSVHRVTS